jgi:hypothetical protein
MSEKFTPKHEVHEALPANQHELITAHATPEKAKHEKDPALAKNEARKALDEISRNETQLDPLERLEAAEKASQPVTPTHINRELKAITLRRELSMIRRKLNKPEQALSRVIHQPVVRVASEAAAKTIRRPSGMLGGGLVALLGTSSYLYLAKHMGFEYNYLVFLVLFAGGFLLGLVLELVVHLATASRRKAQD